MACTAADGTLLFCACCADAAAVFLISSETISSFECELMCCESSDDGSRPQQIGQDAIEDAVGAAGAAPEADDGPADGPGEDMAGAAVVQRTGDSSNGLVFISRLGE